MITVKMRDDCRKIQDRLLKTKKMMIFEAENGPNFPIFTGGPTFTQLSSFVYPEFMEDFLRILAE
jgi:hypothetical protein